MDPLCGHTYAPAPLQSSFGGSIGPHRSLTEHMHSSEFLQGTLQSARSITWSELVIFLRKYIFSRFSYFFFAACLNFRTLGCTLQSAFPRTRRGQPNEPPRRCLAGETSSGIGLDGAHLSEVLGWQPDPGSADPSPEATKEVRRCSCEIRLKKSP